MAVMLGEFMGHSSGNAKLDQGKSAETVLSNCTSIVGGWNSTAGTLADIKTVVVLPATE